MYIKYHTKQRPFTPSKWPPHPPLPLPNSRALPQWTETSRPSAHTANTPTAISSTSSRSAASLANTPIAWTTAPKPLTHAPALVNGLPPEGKLPTPFHLQRHLWAKSQHHLPAHNAPAQPAKPTSTPSPPSVSTAPPATDSTASSIAYAKNTLAQPSSPWGPAPLPLKPKA